MCIKRIFGIKSLVAVCNDTHRCLCKCTGVWFTGEFLEEGGHVLWFVKARPHLGQHLHVFYHQFLHGDKRRDSEHSIKVWLLVYAAELSLISIISIYSSILMSYILIHSLWKIELKPSWNQIRKISSCHASFYLYSLYTTREILYFYYTSNDFDPN